MKKMKGILSLILVLCCMLQFAAPMAMAAPAEDAALDVYGVQLGTDGYEEASISYDGASIVGELATDGLSIVPDEEGKLISRIFFASADISGEDLIAKIESGDNSNWAAYLGGNGGVYIDPDLITDNEGNLLANELFGEIAGDVVLVAVVEDVAATPSISFDSGRIEIESALTALPGDTYTYNAPAYGEVVSGISSAAAAEAEAQYQRFAGWIFEQLGYQPKFVEAGEKVDIIADSTFTAEWNYHPQYSITVKAKDITMASDETFESVMSRMSVVVTAEPNDFENLSVEGVTFEIRDEENKLIGAGPVPAGNYTVHPKIPANAVVTENGNPIEYTKIIPAAGKMVKTVGVTLTFNDGIADISKPLVDASVANNTFIKDKGSEYIVQTLESAAYAEAGDEGYVFTGWEVYFPSTTERFVVKPGEALTLKGDAEFTAQYRSTGNYTVTVTADDKFISAGDEFPEFTATIVASPAGENLALASAEEETLTIDGLSFKVLDFNGDEVTAADVVAGELYEIEVVLPAGAVVKKGELPVTVDEIITVSGVLEIAALDEEAIKVKFDDGFASISKGLVEGASKNTLNAVSNVEFEVPALSEAADKEAVSEGYHFAGWRVSYPELSGAAEVDVYPGDTIVLMDDATFTAQWIVDITITTKDRSAEYNGEVITANKYSISDTDKKKLSNADHRLIDVEIEYEGGTDIVTKKDKPASSSVVLSSVVIRDRKDNDVTAQYNITVKPGKVTVTKCDDKVIIKAKDAEKVFDGTELTEGEATATGLKGEDELVQVITKGAPVRPSESCANKVTSYNIMNGNGKIVTDCYSNIVVEDGYLTIKPKKATITAPSDEEMIRDGSTYELDADDISFEGLLVGHHPEVKVQYLLDGKKATPKDVGYYVIDLYDVTIKDDDKNDFTDCYELTVEDGGLFIKSTEESSVLTIVAPSQTWVYDGEAHVAQTMNSADPEQVKGLKDGDSITFKFSASSTITNAGTKANIIEQVVIKDKNGKAVDPEKYDIKKVPGTLTVTKFPITVTAVSDSKTYDGTALVNKKVEVTELANKDHTISVDYSILDSKGKVAKNGAVDVGEYTKKITDVKIMDGKTDVTDNYEITKVDGKLTIKQGNGTASGTGTGTGTPQTGDSANLGLWIGLLAVSAVVVAAIVVIVIKKGKNKDQQ